MENRILQDIQNFPGGTSKYLRELFGRETEDILAVSRLWTVEAGTRFISAQERITNIYILVAGRVSVLEEYRTGNIYIFLENKVPSIFGEMETIADIKFYLATLVAKTDCLMVAVPVCCYKDFIRRHPAIFYERTQLILKELLKNGGDNRLYLQLQSIDRIKLYFIKKYIKSGKGEVCILKMTKQQIADETGYSLKTVLRSLKTLEADKYLTQAGHKILIDEEQHQKMMDSIDQIADNEL